MSDSTLESIERGLELLNFNLAEANDIATLAAFPSMPADLDNESRKAVRALRDKVMERTRKRTGL